MGEFEGFVGVNFWTALFTLLNFLTVLYVGKRYFWGPVLELIRQRQREVDDMYANAGAAEANAQQLEQECRQKLSAAAARGEGIVRDAVDRAEKREEEILRRADADAAAILDRAAARIAMEKRKALNEAKDEISDMAMAIAEKVIGRALKDTDQEKLVEEFIDSLGDGL